MSELLLRQDSIPGVLWWRYGTMFHNKWKHVSQDRLNDSLFIVEIDVGYLFTGNDVLEARPNASLPGKLRHISYRPRPRGSMDQNLAHFNSEKRKCMCFGITKRTHSSLEWSIILVVTERLGSAATHRKRPSDALFRQSNHHIPTSVDNAQVRGRSASTGSP